VISMFAVRFMEGVLGNPPMSQDTGQGGGDQTPRKFGARFSR